MNIYSYCIFYIHSPGHLSKEITPLKSMREYKYVNIHLLIQTNQFNLYRTKRERKAQPEEVLKGPVGKALQPAYYQDKELSDYYRKTAILE